MSVHLLGLGSNCVLALLLGILRIIAGNVQPRSWNRPHVASIDGLAVDEPLR